MAAVARVMAGPNPPNLSIFDFFRKAHAQPFLLDSVRGLKPAAYNGGTRNAPSRAITLIYDCQWGQRELKAYHGEALYLGSRDWFWQHAGNFKAIVDATGIDCFLDCRGHDKEGHDYPAWVKENLGYEPTWLQFTSNWLLNDPMRDPTDSKFTKDLLQITRAMRNKRTFVFCNQGQSRSALMVAAFMEAQLRISMKKLGRDLEPAWQGTDYVQVPFQICSMLPYSKPLQTTVTWIKL